MGGSPEIGAETTPSGLMVRIAPLLSVTRKLPSGKKANDHGPLSRAVIVCTEKAAEGFAGGGASVWPANAGFGLNVCACTAGSIAAVMAIATAVIFMGNLLIPSRVHVSRTRLGAPQTA